MRHAVKQPRSLTWNRTSNVVRAEAFVVGFGNDSSEIAGAVRSCDTRGPISPSRGATSKQYSPQAPPR